MSTETESVDLVGEETTVNVARAVVFAAVTAATSPINATHPLAQGIPITLQTLWVYLAGLVLGPVWGVASFALYLVAGTVGLPVFAGGSGGVGVLFGKTGGYLVGFVLAAGVIGLVAHGRRGIRHPGDVGVPRLVAALVAGSAVIYACGALGLMAVLGVGPVVAVTTGVLPFLPVGAVKVAAAVGIAKSDAIVPR
ncbi:MAG: biotin transporter BioY [Halobacteriaceae archaeon]